MKIHELLSSPDKWTKGCLARDKEGNRLFSTDPNAVCWCFLGAMQMCYRGLSKRIDVMCKVSDRIGELSPNKEQGFDSIHKWNDSPERTYEDVIKLAKELDV